MALLVKRATAAGLTGLEWGIAVPGTVGGAVWANAGAHGGEMGDRVVASRHGTRPAAHSRLANADCAFGYRESRFKHESLVVIGATWPSSPHLRRGRGPGRRVPGPAGRHPAPGRAERGQRVPQPARGSRRAADRGRRPEGRPEGSASVSAGMPTSSCPTGTARRPTSGAGRAGPGHRPRIGRRGARVRDRVHRGVGDAMSRLRVGVFAGGRSAEHEVSIASAKAVLREIDRARSSHTSSTSTRRGWHLPAGPAPVLASERPRPSARGRDDLRAQRPPRSRRRESSALARHDGDPGPGRGSPLADQSTSRSWPSTGRSARTERSRGSSSWPASHTPAPACWPARWPWTRWCSRT